MSRTTETAISLGNNVARYSECDGTPHMNEIAEAKTRMAQYETGSAEHKGFQTVIEVMQHNLEDHMEESRTLTLFGLDGDIVQVIGKDYLNRLADWLTIDLGYGRLIKALQNSEAETLKRAVDNFPEEPSKV